MNIGYGEFIKRHRIASGFKSQRQLAEASGVSAPTISRMEKEIQKPLVETLKELAPYLKTTYLTELMVVCGYWDKDDLLEPIRYPGEELVSVYNEIHRKDNNELAPQCIDIQENKKSPSSNEEDFVKNIDLTNEELLKQFNLEIDGRSLTQAEAEGVIAYVRALRSMKN